MCVGLIALPVGSRCCGTPPEQRRGTRSPRSRRAARAQRLGRGQPVVHVTAVMLDVRQLYARDPETAQGQHLSLMLDVGPTAIQHVIVHPIAGEPRACQRPYLAVVLIPAVFKKSSGHTGLLDPAQRVIDIAVPKLDTGQRCAPDPESLENLLGRLGEL